MSQKTSAIRPHHLIITLVWIAAISVLALRHYGLPWTRSQGMGTGVFRTSGEPRWMGVYQAGRKIGYASERLEKADAGYSLTEEIFMRLMVMGTEKTVSVKTFAMLDDGLRLKTFNLKMDSDVRLEIEGRIEGDSIVIRTPSGGEKSELRIKFDDSPYLNSSFVAGAFMDELKQKGRLELPFMDPSSFALEKMVIESMGEEEVVALNKRWNGLKVRGAFKGVEVFIWLSPDGEVLKEESLGLTMVREDEKIAKDIERPSTDFIASIAVRPDGKTLPSDDLSYLKVKMSGIPTDGLALSGGGQKEGGGIIEMRVPIITPDAKAAALNPDELKKYSSAGLLIQSDDEGIKNLASEITREGRGDLEKAFLIYRWVYRNIEKTPAMTIPSALEVFQSRRGDCNEHTTLYTALARAAGIPARMAVGLVYQDGAFYYHAWPEVFVPDVYEGGWFPVDPTLGEFPADAGHIRMITGNLDEQARIASAVGRLRIEVLDFTEGTKKDRIRPSEIKGD